MKHLLVCAAEPSASMAGAAACPAESQQWLTVEAAFTPGDLGIDAEGVALVAGWGVGVVLLLWSLGYGIGAAVKVIRAV